MSIFYLRMRWRQTSGKSESSWSTDGKANVHKMPNLTWLSWSTLCDDVTGWRIWSTATCSHHRSLARASRCRPRESLRTGGKPCRSGAPRQTSCGTLSSPMLCCSRRAWLWDLVSQRRGWTPSDETRGMSPPGKNINRLTIGLKSEIKEFNQTF